MKLNDIIQNKRLVVCCGSGGVGKTTTSAAIALNSAISGKKTLVITIDPAKRLAQSLGLEGLDNTERKVPAERFKAAGLSEDHELYAAMLDTKESFDALIRRITSSEAQADRIMNNNIYRQLSNAIAGSQEYVAMERLHEIMQQDKYDMIILDTPPTKNALDFLNAPNRLAAFLDEKIVKWFEKGTNSGITSLLFQKGGEVVYKLLGVLVGDGFIKDLSEFFQSMSGLYSGFRDRAIKVNELLRDKSTVFMLVTSAERNTLNEAVYFHNLLKDASIPLEAVIVNRAYHPDITEEIKLSDIEEFLSSKEVTDQVNSDSTNNKVLGDIGNKLLNLNQIIQELNINAEQNIGRLKASLNNMNDVARVPQFSEDICDIEGLLKMNDYLFSS